MSDAKKLIEIRSNYAALPMPLETCLATRSVPVHRALAEIPYRNFDAPFQPKMAVEAHKQCGKPMRCFRQSGNGT
jgi:hypothetical protein